MQRRYNYNMKNVFIDCGSNIGWAVDFYKNIYPFEDWMYMLIEPNPNCANVLRNNYSLFPNIKIFENAVSTENKIYEFKFHTTLSEGGTINPYKIEDKNNVTNVAGITIENILSITKDYNKKIIKIDIEGEEYSVLEKMIENKTYREFSKIICEFHTQYMQRGAVNFLEKQNNIIKFFSDLNYKIKLISKDQYLIEDDSLPSIQDIIVAH